MIDDPDAAKWEAAFLGDRIFTFASALSALANTPRVLKQGLSRAHETWTVLKGEIDVDDVLALSVLREASPNAFALLHELVCWFAASSQDLDDLFDQSIRDRIKTRAITLMKEGYGGKPELLARNLKGSPKFTLLWLCYGMERVREEASEEPFVGWSAFAPTILDSLRRSPEIMAEHVAGWSFGRAGVFAGLIRGSLIGRSVRRSLAMSSSFSSCTVSRRRTRRRRRLSRLFGTNKLNLLSLNVFIMKKVIAAPWMTLPALTMQRTLRPKANQRRSSTDSGAGYLVHPGGNMAGVGDARGVPSVPRQFLFLRGRLLLRLGPST